MTRDNVVRDWNQLEEMDDSPEMAEASEPEVRETRETAEAETPETGDAEETQESQTADEDLVRLYLRQMGRRRLLTAADERVIGARMEDARAELLVALADLPEPRATLLKTAAAVRAERERNDFRAVVRASGASANSSGYRRTPDDGGPAGFADPPRLRSADQESTGGGP